MGSFTGTIWKQDLMAEKKETNQLNLVFVEKIEVGFKNGFTEWVLFFLFK